MIVGGDGRHRLRCVHDELESLFTLGGIRSTTPIDLDAPIGDIENLWTSGLELMDLIDAGLRITSSDFPVPFGELCKQLSNVAIEGSVDQAETRVQALLEEAQEARQWSIPWGARVEMRFGPFVSIRIFEKENEFSCHFLDAQERYFHVAIGLGASPPRAAIEHLLRLREDDGQPIWNVDAEVSLKLIAAAIVRDFLVVEERERIFGARNLRSRVRGRNLRTIIYLPRVRYNSAHPERWSLPSDVSGERVHHSVVHHLRRSSNASAAQRFLAQRYGIHLPQGFTFVRPHERGAKATDERIRIYRSRSASEMIFDAVASAPPGTRPLWFDFEKDCARILRDRKLVVIHRAATRDGDGGVDLFATASDGQSWVVQCKCWAPHRPVGPEVVRALQGAIQLADRGGHRTSKGMIITTGTLTDGARAAAAALEFDTIEGDEFSQLLIQTNG